MSGAPKLKLHLLGVRVEKELLAEIDRRVAEVRSERRGASVNRSDVVREILWQALQPRRR